jgi:hypothetical protein
VVRHCVDGRKRLAYLGVSDKKRIKLTKALAKVRKSEMISELASFGIGRASPRKAKSVQP